MSSIDTTAVRTRRPEDDNTNVDPSIAGRMFDKEIYNLEDDAIPNDETFARSQVRRRRPPRPGASVAATRGNRFVHPPWCSCFCGFLCVGTARAEFPTRSSVDDTPGASTNGNRGVYDNMNDVCEPSHAFGVAADRDSKPLAKRA